MYVLHNLISNVNNVSFSFIGSFTVSTNAYDFTFVIISETSILYVEIASSILLNDPSSCSFNVLSLWHGLHSG